ncbi:ABC-2 type transport system ATP-binding protein [Lactobacillus colini]|uniref:ABC-2 type transport system ATP-binding protein n=1 Tax=Lactobacillus colini TaxID=1819254 RepID=A0ABS4MG98_9LACO|nr:ABC transporter ATP-binding protein [Lactobacillus colini]MBP2058724.1 ABC-2 type transport system ATP-binding protein [Lactobacillus colini]
MVEAKKLLPLIHLELIMIMQNTVLKAKGITRYYNDKKNKKIFHAIEDISFSVHEGEVVSFVGPNGAGKTTLLKSISNYLVPTSGSIKIMDIDLLKDPKKARRKLGVVFGGDRGFYNNASAKDNLEFFARLLYVKEKDIKINVLNALKTVNLDNVANKAVGTFSKGMLQRLHIARGLVNNPKILMLDEPTVGLDIESVLSIRHLVKELTKKGCGIILTSHNMEDIETLADTIFLIGSGRIHYQGSLEGVKKFAQVDANSTLTQAYLAVSDELKRK